MHDLSIYGRRETEASALGDKFRPRQTETDRYTYRQRDIDTEADTPKRQ